MLPDIEELKKNSEKIHWNQGLSKGNGTTTISIGQCKSIAHMSQVSANPPFEKHFFFPSVYANRYVCSNDFGLVHNNTSLRPAGKVMANILGPRPQIRYIRSNTLVGKTAERQAVHKDCGL